MKFPLRSLAPAGAPIRFTDLVSASRLVFSRDDPSEALGDVLGVLFGVRHSFVTSTGRAGMTLLLRALRRLAPPERDEVILPAYTCYSVAASVIKAGLRPRIVDISPETLDYAPDSVQNADFSRVLAIVATNLYGIPNDLPVIRRMAHRHGAFVIDDAAQAMGASVDGAWSGTCGDAGLFSFDKGKNVSSIDGGVVVTNSQDVAAAMRQELATVPAPHARGWASDVAKVLAYFVFLRPSLYWVPNHVPQLELGKTVFTTEVPLTRPSRPLAALGATMVSRLDEFTRARIANATALLDGLRTIAPLRTIQTGTSVKPVYLRLPILFPDSDLRRRAGEVLRACGIGASESYPASLADLPQVREHLRAMPVASGGRHVASRILTLPTHPFVEAQDVARTIAVLHSVLTSSTAVERSALTISAS